MLKSRYVEDLFLEFMDLCDNKNIELQHQDQSAANSFYVVISTAGQLTKNQANFLVKILQKYILFLLCSMPQRLPDNGIFNYCNIRPGAIPSAWHADLDIQLSIQVEGCLRRIQGNEDAFQPTLIILSRADNFHQTD
jgi:hypothetical protein